MAKKRKSQARAQRRRSVRPRVEHQQGIPYWVWLAGGGVVVVLLVAGLFYLGYNGQTIANSDIEGLIVLPAQDRQHLEGDIDYVDLTPSGGSHNPQWLNCGIFEEPVRPENVLHSMEHGAVWLSYEPNLPEEQVEVLRNLVNQERSRQGEPLIILAPMPGLEIPIVATAWRVRLELEDASDERLQAFVDRYQRGPFTPEPGASCAFGGVMN
jgi:hypothetical protein